jgi:signal transduction histidine kinase/DNA-binding response OmpR family regulator/streptogramin lyase
MFTFHKTGNRGGIYAIREDKSGDLWAGTEDGLYKFDREEGIFTCYKYDPQDTYSLSHNFVLAIYEDRSGVIWVGTRVDLNKFDREMKNFIHYRHNPVDINSLSHNFVWSVLEDSHGILWIGTGNGLNRYNRECNLFTRYKHDPKNPESLIHNCVFSIHEDRSGNLWFGTANGLDKFDRETGKFTHYRNKRSSRHSLSHNVISRIFTDRAGFLWVGTFSGGLNRFDPHREVFSCYANDPDDPGSLSSNNVTSIYEDRAGFLWVGTEEGLNRFNREQERFTRYKKKPLNSHSLSSDKIESIYEDRSGVLWIGTHGGLNSFDRDEQAFTSYTETYGLPYVIYGILEDDNGNLWLSSNKGIFKFNPRDGTIKGYDVKDGLQDYHFNNGAFFKSKSGEMFFGGANGLNAFCPDEIMDNLYIPPVVITSFKVLNRYYKPAKSILETRELQLSYKDTFSFEFAALCFSQPGKNRYAYKLQGAEGGWVALGKKREITFSNLAPRNYILKIKGSNDDGVWNEQGRSLIIKITPPYWQTWWARFLGFFLIFIIIYFFYRLRVKNIQAQRTKLETQVKERTKELEQANRFKSDFLARMSHEIRTPLNAILGFNEMMLDAGLNAEQLDYTRTAVRSGESLLTIINDILDLSKVESGQLKLEFIDFDPEVTVFDVCELIRPKIDAGSVEIICRIGDNVPAFVNGDPGRFRQVLVNLMSNAAKFTEKGEIELSLNVEDESETALTLHTVVRDSGIGIPENKMADIFEYFHQVDGSISREYGGSGLGLTICKQLSKLMGGDILVESDFGRGSTFHFFAVMGKSGKKAASKALPVVTQGKRALVMDDNEHSLEILDHLLRVFGMDVIVLRRGAEVLPVLKEAKKKGRCFDICILDIHMPDISGFDVARLIRGKNSPCPKPLLLASTSSPSVKSRDLSEAGFAGLLPKPVGRVKLAAILEQLFGEGEVVKEVGMREDVVVRHSVSREDKQAIRILLAEDDPVNRKLANYMLSGAGYRLKMVNNGKEAVVAYCAEPDSFDIILMDLQMPEMSGIEAAGTIRARGFARIPIIAITAQAMKGDRERCLKAGMNDYLTKPIKKDAIFAIITRWTH